MRLAMEAAFGLACAALAGCAPARGLPPANAPAPADAAAPQGDWTVFEIDGRPTVAGSRVTIGFAKGRLYGAAGCNRYMGSYSLSDDGLTLKTGPMASTMMACADDRMAQEGQFLDVLGAVSGFRVADGVLTLTAPAGRTIRARR